MNLVKDTVDKESKFMIMVVVNIITILELILQVPNPPNVTENFKDYCRMSSYPKTTRTPKNINQIASKD